MCKKLFTRTSARYLFRFTFNVTVPKKQNKFNKKILFKRRCFTTLRLATLYDIIKHPLGNKTTLYNTTLKNRRDRTILYYDRYHNDDPPLRM